MDDMFLEAMYEDRTGLDFFAGGEDPWDSDPYDDEPTELDEYESNPGI